MKQINFITIVLLISFLTSSCEKEHIIAKTFKDKTTDKPIPGLLVGLYKMGNGLSYDTTIDSVKLISTAKTDSTGRVVFELKDDDLQFTIQYYFFLPVYTPDTTSVNARFTFNLSGDYPTAGWNPNETVYLYPYYDIQLLMNNLEENEPLKLKYDGEFYDLLFNGSSYFHIFLRPGEYHHLEFYKESNSGLTLIDTKSVYVKFQNDESKYLFRTDVPHSIFSIKLGQ